MFLEKVFVFVENYNIIKLMVASSNCASCNIIIVNRGPAGKTSLNFVIRYFHPGLTFEAVRQTATDDCVPLQ